MVWSAAQVLQRFLIAQGLAVTASVKPLPGQWPIVRGDLPVDADSPDNFVAVRDSGANLEGREMRTGTRGEFPTVQVLIRGLSYEVGWAKGGEVQELFNRVGLPIARGGLGRSLPVQMTAGSPGTFVYLSSVHIETYLTPLGGPEEVRRRQKFVINVRVTLGD